MKTDINSFHTFEVPIYVVPEEGFRENMKLFSQSLAVPIASVQYWRDKLTFTSISETGEEISFSITPILRGLSKSRASKVWQQISNFASKFNCAMSLIEKDGIQLSVDVIDASDEDKITYGKKVCCIIKAKVVVATLPLELALDNFFRVIDMSPRNRSNR